MVTIALYVCPHTVLSSLCIAIDAFQAANQFAGERQFRLLRISATGREVRTAFGTVAVDGGLDRAREADIFIIAAIGRDVDAAIADNGLLAEWLRMQHDAAAAQQFVSLCSGAFLLGAAGLLDGRRVTTHWALERAFRGRFPRAQLAIDELLTQDGNILCSGGAYAGLDLCLYLVGRHGGEWLARQVANALVFELGRGNQSQFAPLVPSAAHHDALIAKLQLWLDAHFADAVSVEVMAERAHCSPRTLLRRFKLATGMTPNEYLQRTRITAAQGRLIKGSMSIEAVAAAVGYQDRAAFAKLFKRLTGATPAAFRRQHGRTPAGTTVPVAR